MRRSVDFAWRTHSAVTDWTAKVDTKASIVLSLGGVLLGFIVTLSTDQRLLTGLQGRALLVERIGLIFLIGGVGLTALVVAPRINRRSSRRHWKDNIVYFGHLRHWDPKALTRHLERLTEADELAMLASQLVRVSKIAWYKHSCLQAGMVLIGGGTLCVTWAVLI